MRSVLFACLLVGLGGCYASEKLGKDVQDTSHDVRQHGISMKNGAIGVYRAPELTSAEMPAVTPVKAVAVDGEQPLPRKDEPSSSLFPQAEMGAGSNGANDLANAPIIPPPVPATPAPVTPVTPAVPAPAPAAPLASDAGVHSM